MQSAGAVLDLTDPEALLNARAGNRISEIEKHIAANKPMEEYLRGQLCEAPNLGLFFSESVCYRSEGLTYSPCGQEFTLLPGESINESNHLTTVQTNAETGVSTTDQALTTTTSNDEQESFAS
ncbi:hypothetical protein [Roseinatronobacter monicus]|uniref:Uncharacterized protein n=1 Tax=Roseinatronobacter monicus TaxID=393481 RepID=A0A543K3P3_9RHOB|nr:hypothetical protein [Roseinatronobacter monicus]TQM89685.1 hypothetical protein BD293_4355 [Roseinatronobacter monicus]